MKAQTSPPDPASQIYFARYLHLNGYYGYAARTYEPLLRVPFDDTLTLFWLQTSQKAGLWQSVADFTTKHTIAYNQECARLYARLMMQNSAYSHLLSNSGQMAYQRLGINQQSQIRFGANFLSSDFINAKQTLISNPNIQNYKLYEEWIVQSAKIPHRSPAFAAIASAILPGSGKMYAGEWKDGLMAFGSIAINGWQTYRGFRDRGSRSVLGWISGAIGTSFYIGNIWGSHRAAKRFNKRKKDAFLQEKKSVILADMP